MHSTLADYEILNEISRDQYFATYQGMRKEDERLVLMKSFTSSHPSLEVIAMLKNEYTILKDLKIEGVLKTYALEQHQHDYYLIQEDFPGVSLDRLIRFENLSLNTKMLIAIEIVKVVGQIHEHEIIHKDIQPQHILVNLEEMKVKITGFGLATRLPRQRLSQKNPALQEGNLAYISPEQTGRMNRDLDYRTDFYSLGVCLYELFTGQLPFKGKDTLEIMHAHIAKNPKPTHDINPEIPIPISMIIAKLMAKTVEERYNSAYGVLHDLNICREEFVKTGIVTPFILGKKDFAQRFQMSHRIVGREDEVRTMMRVLDRLTEGDPQLVLVTGYSGIGKSSVVYELQKSILQKRGFFIAGKCEQFKMNIPYYPFLEAFRDLVQQILTESDNKIEMWKERLNHSLGINAGVIVEVLPELRLIVGDPPKVQELDATAMQNRFNLYIERFIATFATLDTPLVVFLDDLQWIDLASLKLIELLINNLQTKGLLLIGAYRDNEVQIYHPLTEAVERIVKNGGKVERIDIKPLDLENIKILLGETLRCSPEDCKDLAKIVSQKTQGNPFFINQLMTYLYEEKLLNFDTISGTWQWDLDEIASIKKTDNVVELLVEKLKKTSQITQEILKIAACTGNNFDIRLLSNLTEKSHDQVLEGLQKALKEGFITFNESTNEYLWKTRDEKLSKTGPNALIEPLRFAHNKVQQACYTLFNDDERKRMHLKIAHLLYGDKQEFVNDDTIFDVVYHLNQAQDIITDSEEKLRVAKLNSNAAKKAVKSVAYGAALDYLNVGLPLLPQDKWENHYDLTFDMYIHIAEATFMLGNFDEAAQIFDMILTKAHTTDEKIEIYILKIKLNIQAVRYDIAIENGREALKLLGENLPPKVHVGLSAIEFIKVKARMFNKNTSDLQSLPVMKDHRMLQIMSILTYLTPPTYLTNKNMFAYVTLKALNYNLKYGNTALSPFLFSIYGIIQVAFFHNYKEAYEMGRFAFDLSHKFENKHNTPPLKFVYGTFLLPFSKHLRTSIDILKQCFDEGTAHGDWVFSIFSLGQMIFAKYACSEPLEELDKELKKYVEFVNKIKAHNRGFFFKGVIQTILALRGGTNDPWSMQTVHFNEEKFFATIEESKFHVTLYFTLTLKMHLTYLFEKYDQTEEYGKKTEDLKFCIQGQPVEIVNAFYLGLALAANYPWNNPIWRKKYDRRLKKILKMLKRTSDSCLENFLHMYLLVKAEVANVSGNYEEAVEFYDGSIESARENGFVQDEALANELFARFYLSKHKPRLAKQYLIEAIYNYYRWGAFAKINQLEKKYPQLVVSIQGDNGNGPLLPHFGAQGGSTHTLDLSTVFKATQAIAKEIVLEKLLSQLMKIVIENAGAQKAVLILEKDQKWVVEAEQSTDTEEALLLKSIPIEDKSKDIPLAIIQYVLRTSENVVLDNPFKEGMFSSDQYISTKQPQSILCFPLIHKGKLTGVLYLENNLTRKAFTPNRVELLKLLTSQIATSIENALLYSNLSKLSRDLKISNEKLADYNQNLERKVNARTHELKDKNKQLEDTLMQIKEMQKRLIEQEKLVSLSVVSKSIAQEMRNPINYIYNFSTLACELLNELKDATDHTDNKMNKLTHDIESNLIKICEHSHKADEIVTSMLKNSRSSESILEPTDLNKLIKDYADLVYYSYYKKDPSFSITLETNYDPTIGKINAYPSNLGRVFYHIINNACESTNQKKLEVESNYSPIVSITTRNEKDSVYIRIWDNGKGISKDTLEKVFTPFTSSNINNKNTGMGLSISHDIIVQEHGGKIDIKSEPDEFTEIIIMLPKIGMEAYDS